MRQEGEGKRRRGESKAKARERKAGHLRGVKSSRKLKLRLLDFYISFVLEINGYIQIFCISFMLYCYTS